MTPDVYFGTLLLHLGNLVLSLSFRRHRKKTVRVYVMRLYRTYGVFSFPHYTFVSIATFKICPNFFCLLTDILIRCCRLPDFTVLKNCVLSIIFFYHTSHPIPSESSTMYFLFYILLSRPSHSFLRLSFILPICLAV